MNKRKYYLSTMMQDTTGDILAVISLGSPQKGDKEVVVCDVERCKTKAEAEAWFRQQMMLKPWEDELDETC
jgi:hypothetical protein